MQGVVEEIYIASQGSADMERMDQVEALEQRGLHGDRYCERRGYWTGVDECQVTLIEAEGLEEIIQTTGIHVENGQHRRNIITRNLQLKNLRGKQFQIGEALLEYDRPRPPCSYIQSITEPGMTRALARRGGICARVVKPGIIRPGDNISIL